MQNKNKPLIKIERHILPLLGNEIDEWHHKKFKTHHAQLHHQIQPQVSNSKFCSLLSESTLVIHINEVTAKFVELSWYKVFQSILIFLNRIKQILEIHF